ncbi:hypothetical protein [Halalkalibacter oceani]|uniref:hypothetical protein n=1 Tax=Halalkalibacter oceani TaxID=1653776 RepID=UPI003394E289
MKKFEELNSGNSTIVEFEGKEYRTLQDAYVSDDGSEYKAHAVDENDKEYMIYWETINFDTSDESEACDWDNPIRVENI